MEAPPAAPDPWGVKRSLAGQAKPTETGATPMEIPELLLPTCGKHVDNEDGRATAQQVSRGDTHYPQRRRSRKARAPPDDEVLGQDLG